MHFACCVLPKIRQFLQLSLSFVEYLEDGMHIIEVPGEKMGSEEEKLRIFILKDQRSVGNRSIGYLGLDVLDSNNGPE